eukprot:CAMPEP_0181290318 /NCGR_PEP_ID=MMETSP1101-20121128/1350_1 /TAXON_ID=46948 /ORGANISM="Rhodomonas abbreviata, Strain Caron Lab Isolate" /LENGTH=52 /DNA_ID=CAMNT_0023394595 /DNA_START=714 /DNA_END=873 /DNA_ORIENTATION=+
MCWSMVMTSSGLGGIWMELSEGGRAALERTGGWEAAARRGGEVLAGAPLAAA